MSVVAHKLELFENIARLRRAAREMPGSKDLAAVRAALEDELGPTVSQRLAGRILGVSHVALRRWIDSGDLPLVYTTKGRQEVPVPALLRLRDEIEEDQGPTRHRYAIKSTMARHHKEAKAIKVPKSKGGAAHVRVVGFDDPHLRNSVRNLAYHQAVARKLRKTMVEEARHVLYRWREEGKINEHYARRWERVLERPVPEIRKAIIKDDAEADDLRQNSPFAGQLSEAERRRILKEVV